MENSTVNMAHQQQRRAESLLRCHRFTEAIDCHERVCDLLAKAEQETESASALESIRSQREYHMQQKNIIRLKQSQLEHTNTAKDKERLSSHPSEDDSTATTVFAPRRSALPEAIYREMEQADSLLSFLLPLPGTLETDATLSTTPATPPELMGQKLPKELHHVTEELRLCNQHLRQLVEALVAELDARTRQVDDLQRRLHDAQSKLPKYSGTRGSPGANAASPAPSSNTSPSSDASASPPLLVSPFTELVPDGTAPPPPRNLPQLAPLEMPLFDFSLFRPSNSESGPPPL